MPLSQVRLHMTGRQVVALGQSTVTADSKITFADLDNIGVSNLVAMDSALTGPAMSSGNVPKHMLQTWLPGTLRTITQARTIDEIVGISTIGNWHDELISVKIAEPVAKAELYGDYSNIPLASYRTSEESRGVVRFEQGFQVGKLEEARQGAYGYNAADEKRRATSESLDIGRNDIGFYGYNSADTNVYGLLNEPGLPTYKGAIVPWLTADFDQLVTEFTAMMNELEKQSGGKVKDDANLALVIPTGYRSIFTTYSQSGSGMTFRVWLKENYPNLRIVSAPEFTGANGGVDVAYLFIEDAGTYDDSDVQSSTFVQPVPSRYHLLGSENRIKGYIEDATNATSGTFCLRPWAVTRKSISV